MRGKERPGMIAKVTAPPLLPPPTTMLPPTNTRGCSPANHVDVQGGALVGVEGVAVAERPPSMLSYQQAVIEGEGGVSGAEVDPGVTGRL